MLNLKTKIRRRSTDSKVDKDEQPSSSMFHPEATGQYDWLDSAQNLSITDQSVSEQRSEGVVRRSNSLLSKLNTRLKRVRDRSQGSQADSNSSQNSDVCSIQTMEVTNKVT